MRMMAGFVLCPFGLCEVYCKETRVFGGKPLNILRFFISNARALSNLLLRMPLWTSVVVRIDTPILAKILEIGGLLLKRT